MDKRPNSTNELPDTLSGLLRTGLADLRSCML